MSALRRISLANANGFANEIAIFFFCFVLAVEIPCEWKFATKFASECECDGLVHSAPDRAIEAAIAIVIVGCFGKI